MREALFELVSEKKLTWDLPARLGEHDELTAPLVYKVKEEKDEHA